jgi:hypothetical protein
MRAATSTAHGTVAMHHLGSGHRDGAGGVVKCSRAVRTVRRVLAEGASSRAKHEIGEGGCAERSNLASRRATDPVERHRSDRGGVVKAQLRSVDSERRRRLALASVLLALALGATIWYWPEAAALKWYWKVAIAAGYLVLVGIAFRPSPGGSFEKMQVSLARRFMGQGKYSEAQGVIANALRVLPESNLLRVLQEECLRRRPRPERERGDNRLGVRPSPRGLSRGLDGWSRTAASRRGFASGWPAGLLDGVCELRAVGGRVNTPAAGHCIRSGQVRADDLQAPVPAL